ncbi:exodeoxyribonuclease VII small subunit [Aedoeadaptatus ivorii]|uniref:Exodeoxyribonuclease 7 small subunit n=1 Tax=Aedoeadaptatus ivorii TaxID=54006 RepID=A0A3S5C2F1_9FIRM|nr:exodeoxyribonuclease VII small subunit [Peptoniphilus ivorii]MDQ0507750.1 exodeoxyribonuclease VII small subunit [Peptoniphilus ivorii]VEJ35537.1 exodeoxyribonuclease VII small subunit [Peptoniphilus ivorii]
MNYKEKSDRLATIVETMENEDLSLEEMVQLYEEGIALYRALDEELSKLEQKVRILTEDGLEEKGEALE